jgi:chromosome partitioning protein
MGAKRIVVANQKGGVGKTTTAVNLSAALQAAGKRVLLVDFDPQGNATSGFGLDKNTLSPSVYDVLIGKVPCEQAIAKTPYGDVLPSNKALAGAAIELVEFERREYLLSDALDTVEENYDYIMIDCPPSLELLTLNGIVAAKSVLIPVQCEYYALEGLSDLMGTLRLVKRRLNPDISVEGVLLTMYNGRTNLSMQVAEEVKRHFKGQVYATVIPRNTRLAEAPSHGKPVIAYDKWSKGAEAYQNLAQEVLERNAT